MGFPHIVLPCWGPKEFFTQPMQTPEDIYGDDIPPPGSPDQTPVTLTQAVGLYWRVAQWELSGTVSTSYTGHDMPAPEPIPDLTFDERAVTTLFVDGDPTNDLDLTNMRESYILLQRIQQIIYVDGEGGWRSEDGKWSAFLTIRLGGPPPMKSEGSIFPQHISFEVASQGFFGNYTSFSDGQDESSVDFDIAGVSQKLFGTVSDWSASGSLSIKPKQWFTYGGKFDPDTGAPT